ncbi:MAG TPA: ABC transporter ATP-binding protein [Candidatus Pullichristensenella stercorigallinarum]|uniref:ABC transporter ATP-binding protein n=1 Tax=Candidatus Pullichristensenella stercorigallinarum TaxID=2840909 RepID=A0A9D0ZM71_9FIRM|nr:ABC transporter ATP-binding protein [Candidatus Pullichristensenella stercorigallinarum]
MSKRFSYSIPTMTRRLLKIARPVRGALWVSTLASIVGNLSQMGLMGFGALLLLSCGGMVKGLPWVYAGLMGISALLIVLGRYIEGVVSHAGAYRLLASMRVHLYESIRRLAPACLMERKKGDLLNIAVSDIETVEFFFAHTIGPMFTVILLPCVTLGLALWFHPLFAAVLLPVYLVVSIIFPLLAVKAGRGIGMRYRTRLGEMKSLVLESVYGLRDIQIFGFGPRRLEQVLEKNREVNQAAHGMTLHRQVVSTAPTFFVYLARILVIGAASWLAVSGAPDPVGTVVLSFVAAASFSSTQSLTMVVSSLLETYAAAERLFLLEDTPPEITEPAHPVSCGPIRSIQFDHVGFSYGNSSKAILEDFCLTVSSREKVGLVGESGVGKSTVLRLLLRFWNAKSGQIRVNGIPLERVSLAELRRRIAVLEQDTFLFNGTLGENIALGKPDASPEEIAEAARRAGLEAFIQTLPQGYDTPMGQMGARLSGGERQRVGIARVMLLDPDVIVMDEPTSSLDVLHEKELLLTLREQCGDKMLLIVSHRPSTLTGCDRIVRLENKRAVASEGM